MWREHALHTARVLNEINPDFIRIRTLAMNSRVPLYREVESGNFIRQTDEEIVEEVKLLIEHLECQSQFVSDHVTNLLQEIEGKLPEDKEKLLGIIKRFQALPEEERHNFRVGRRFGIYTNLDELSDARRYEEVSRTIEKMREYGHGVDDNSLHNLVGRFI